jgi:hypothetical protein
MFEFDILPYLSMVPAPYVQCSAENGCVPGTDFTILRPRLVTFTKSTQGSMSVVDLF